jgi:uncharacterized membrane protein (UPF0182 family)
MLIGALLTSTKELEMKIKKRPIKKRGRKKDVQRMVCLIFAGDRKAAWVRKFKHENNHVRRLKNGTWVRQTYWVMNYSKKQIEKIRKKPVDFFHGVVIDSMSTTNSVWSTLAHLLNGQKFCLRDEQLHGDFRLCSINPL